MANQFLQKRIQKFTFDPSANTYQRAAAAHPLIGGALPNGAVITDAWIDVITTFTSPTTDDATIALSTGQAANDLVSAIAIDAGTTPWAAGMRGTLMTAPNMGADAAHDTALETIALFAAIKLKLTDNRQPVATVGVEALTAGKLDLYVEYYIA